MKPGALHRSRGIHLITEEIPGKLRLGDTLKKVFRPVISSKLSHVFDDNGDILGADDNDPNNYIKVCIKNTKMYIVRTLVGSVVTEGCKV